MGDNDMTYDYVTDVKRHMNEMSRECKLCEYLNTNLHSL